jgi:hypothetical protein
MNIALGCKATDFSLLCSSKLARESDVRFHENSYAIPYN